MSRRSSPVSFCNCFSILLPHIFCPSSQCNYPQQLGEPGWSIPWVSICTWRGCELPALWFAESCCPWTAVWAGCILWHVNTTWWSLMQLPHLHCPEEKVRFLRLTHDPTHPQLQVSGKDHGKLWKTTCAFLTKKGRHSPLAWVFKDTLKYGTSQIQSRDSAALNPTAVSRDMG